MSNAQLTGLVLVLSFGCGSPAQQQSSTTSLPQTSESEGDLQTQGPSLNVNTESAEGETPAPEATVVDLAPSQISQESAVGASPGRPLATVDLSQHAGRIVGLLRAARGRQRFRRRALANGTVGFGSANLQGALGEAQPAPERAAEESVTNNQVAGVDEGGIVKAWRNHLVILRRGRLFTAALGDVPGSAAARAAIDLNPPGDDTDVWYDELLVHPASGTAIVTGYSYQEEATQLAFFSIGADGSIARGAVHWIRANDYYSSRNYASRLIGDSLVLYSPHYLLDDDWERIRVSRAAVKSGRSGRWRSLMRGRRVHRLPGGRDASTLHMLIRCQFSAERLDCNAQGILGSSTRTSYVTQEALYLWIQPSIEEWQWEVLSDQAMANLESRVELQPSYLVKMALVGDRAPQAVAVHGSPLDQFSFHQTTRDLWVNLRAEGAGDTMWAPEQGAPPGRLLKLPLSAFGSRVRQIDAAAYRQIPSPRAQRAHQNRFVGEYLLYGAGMGWGGRNPASEDRVYLHRTSTGENFAVSLGGGVDRIEALGNHALVVGSDGEDLHFQALRLASRPAAVHRFVQRGARQGETRSHGFFYRALAPERGLLGLPTIREGNAATSQLLHGSAQVMFLSVNDLALTPLGALEATPAQQDDRCSVSCVDWYGNARPLFYRSRLFALLGYELVEAAIQPAGLEELGRMSFLSVLPPATESP